jgi:hypothetical protein
MTDFKKFRESLGSSGPYLKAKDFEAGREVIIQPWIYKGELTNALLYVEGWVWDEENGGQKKNKKKPVRFSMEEFADGIDFDQYDFSFSSYQGKTSRDTPKGAIALLLKDIESQEIKLASFTQVTLCNSLLKYLDPESKFYNKNIDKKILVIGKENDRLWTATTKDDDDDLCSSFESALDTFIFSWDGYMNGDKDIFENGDNYQDILALMDKSPKKSKPAAKKATAKKEIELDDDIKRSWGNVKTPKGTKLGTLSLDDLEQIKAALEKKKDYENNLLYKATLCGIMAHTEDEPALEDLEDVDF